jgi:uncharacterized membrane protein
MNETLEKSAIGLDGNVAAALGYPIGILGLVSFFIEKQNRFVKFHGIQSVLYSLGLWVGFIVLLIVLFILSAILAFVSGTLATLVSALTGLLGFGVFLIWFGSLLFFAYKAYQGQMFKLPVVGNIAENLANK